MSGFLGFTPELACGFAGAAQRSRRASPPALGARLELKLLAWPLGLAPAAPRCCARWAAAVVLPGTGAVLADSA